MTTAYLGSTTVPRLHYPRMTQQCELACEFDFVPSMLALVRSIYAASSNMPEYYTVPRIT